MYISILRSSVLISLMKRIKDIPLPALIGIFVLILGALAFIPGLLPAVERLVKTAINNGTGNLESDDTQYKDVNITIRDKLEQKRVPDVAVEIISNGPPNIKTSDSNGYFELQVPKRKSVEIFLSKDGYKSERYMVNLQTDPDTAKTFYIESKQQQASQSQPSVGGAELRVPEPSSEIGENAPPVTDGQPDTINSAKSRSISSAGTLPSTFVGQWDGNLDQTNSSRSPKFEVSLTEGDAGSKVGTVVYSASNCKGSLILQSVSSSKITLVENIYHGIRCANGGQITLKSAGSDIIDFSWNNQDKKLRRMEC